MKYSIPSMSQFHLARRAVLRMGLMVMAMGSYAMAQWTHRYPQVEGFGHHIYLEGYDLPILTSGPMDPAPSPSGGEVAFTARGWLWIMDLSTGIARRVTASAGMDSRPEWSPDGTQLVFIRDDGDGLSIVTCEPVTGTERVLVNTQAVHLDPIFNPDGGSVVYASAEGGALELWRVALDSLEREPLSVSTASRSRGVKRHPLVLAQDALLIYLNKALYYDSIELLNTKTGEHQTLIEHWISAPSDMSLSPDGKLLAFTWPSEQGTALRLMTVADSSTSILLTESLGAPLAPAFSHDGQWIWFAEADDQERTSLKRIRVHGGPVQAMPVKQFQWNAPMGRVIIQSKVDGVRAPIRLNVQDASGHPVIPEYGTVRYEGHHGRTFFYSQGEIELDAPVGPIRITAVQGFETPERTQEITIRQGKTTKVTLDLTRVWDASEGGWFAGDNHFHLNYGGHYRLTPDDIIVDLLGEGLDFAIPLVANLHNNFKEQPLLRWHRDEAPLIRFGQEVRAHSHGHVALFGVDDYFWPWIWGPGYQVYGQDDRINADALRHAREQGGLGAYVHPVAVDDPFAGPGRIPPGFVADAVLGQVDLLEVACLYTSEVGTASLWHAILNLGIPLAATAGSDVMNNYYRTFAIGTTRMYVKPATPFTAASYFEALSLGRSFVSTGPLLDFRVAGKEPGGVVEGNGKVQWGLNLHSAQPIQSVQLFVNGEIVEDLGEMPKVGSKTFSGSIDVPAGGWITARATGTSQSWPAMNPGLFAETSPIWFGARGSTDPESKRAAAQVLLTALNQSEDTLENAYGPVPIPKIKAHFEQARKKLLAMASNQP